jgi:fused signal recognition particle receptor
MGDTGIIIAIVAAVVVIGVVVWYVMRGKGAALPEETQRPTERAEPPPKAKPAAAEPKAERPKKPTPPPTKSKATDAEAAPEKKPSIRPEAPVAEEEPADEEEDEALEAAPPRRDAEPKAAPAAKKKAPSADDVKALKKGLASTRGGFIARLAKLFGAKKEIDPQLLEELQEVLITADIGVKTSEKILARLKERMDKNELGDEDRVWEALREEARAILARDTQPVLSKRPSVILVVGVNGVGKTTTIGKLASRFKDEGKKVILAAGDTFRAAAVLQLEVWGRRVGCEVVKGKERADPGAVIFDAIKKAKDEGADIVIADTAGRLHTKANLMEELKKVARTAEKALERPVDEVLLVLDSTTGQNAIQQAQLFKDAIPVSGIALTKLDGTAKGGVILGIVDEHDLPVYFVGIGERVEDLREFDATTFVEALFAKPDDESLAA